MLLKRVIIKERFVEVSINKRKKKPFVLLSWNSCCQTLYPYLSIWKIDPFSWVQYDKCIQHRPQVYHLSFWIIISLFACLCPPMSTYLLESRKFIFFKFIFQVPSPDLTNIVFSEYLFRIV